ncbi:N-acyl-phosphatidylethanolamine-hydrolyzing phospholipase D-like isoform X1 [Dreissena polymorpha]|uniref:N-acyl-phosphatidylethanolamine-hydrolyzing phospholipase D-like isoform X1 n=1 Tax=Dreissena polymorpha TaxID=45954 RepID=UPI0022653A75|nr:N-acyl-phosphatidylethanolamine-hydrolyzing phospholipase D-like isoform X1 [Dreissena polymorpha]
MASVKERKKTLKLTLPIQKGSALSPPVEKLDGVTSPSVANVDGVTSHPVENVDGVTSPSVANVDGVTSHPVENVDGVTSPPVENVDSVTSPPVANVDGVTSPPVANVDGVTSPPVANVDGVTSHPVENVDGVTSPVANVDGVTSPPFANIDGVTFPPVANVDGVTSHPVANVDGVTSLGANVDDFTGQEEDLTAPDKGKTRVTWIGHATLLVEFDGITVLTDPVFGSHAAPRQLSIMPYKRYRPAACQVVDIPHLDAVIISHDHYDHLETNAVLAIHARFPDVHWFVALSTKEWLVKKGCTAENITELEWWQEATYGKIRFVCTPSQHWCQRSPFDLNSRLWCSWLIQGPTQTFYFAGDTGYFEPLFKAIGERYKKIHLAAIPIGAYNPRFITEYQHVDPEEAVLIHEDIKSDTSIGIHWGTFQLTNEHYLEPPHRLKKAMKDRNLDPNKFVCLNIGETWIVGDDREEPNFMKENVKITTEDS